MRRALSITVVAFALVSLVGCASLGRPRASKGTTAAAKKDCAACEKMCAVAGDVENNPAAVEDCKADCRATCTEK